MEDNKPVFTHCGIEIATFEEDNSKGNMKIRLLVIGKTHSEYLSAIQLFEKRLPRYAKFSLDIIPELRQSGKINMHDLKKAEGVQILKRLADSEELILLDEKGKSYDSRAFSVYLEDHMAHSRRDLCFAIGGAYGFSEEVYRHAKMKISLSQMTFSHQLARLVFLEQLYRAFTIIKGEPYHHG